MHILKAAFDWLRSPHWAASAVRVFTLVFIGWYALQWAIYRTYGDVPLIDAWPKTNFAKTTVDLNEIESGGPPKDGIPAIDRPKFVSVAAAEKWLDADEPVIAVTIGNHSRAYPLQIMIWHEIVNDSLSGEPIAVTFCPLCNASLVFSRRLDGEILDFGTTGKLRLSDLVMYDRQTESWWQQFTGEGIVGDYAGRTLREMPSQIISFSDFASAAEDGEVLSRRTGYSRSYGRNPYRGYDSITQSPFMFSGNVDNRLPPMERVLAVQRNGAYRIYPFGGLREQSVVNDQFQGVPLVVLAKSGTLSVLDKENIRESKRVPSAVAYVRHVNNQVLEFELRDGKFFDRQTGSQWNMLGHAVAGPLNGTQLTALPGGVHFAFAWLAFRPDTQIYTFQ
ncbi:MAG: DUF3179 domain-containing protein [Gammaproteobacteria bacterium]|nr:DUF3179 domain-containing protein [Gammaproteobacteria bacterium]